MKKENIIKILIGVLIFILLIILGIGVNKYRLNNKPISNDKVNEKQEEQNKEELVEETRELEFNNMSGETKDTVELENIKLSDFALLNLGESIKITGKVENISDEAVENVKLSFELLDLAGAEILEYKMEIPEKIESKEIREIETVIGFSNENINTLNVELIKN